ncbi:MAG: glycosyltransferase family 4 protein [Bacteroidetes bacterium]|nr:glycosyltransferase family 4 protein [Bacteroidota bacterium]
MKLYLKNRLILKNKVVFSSFLNEDQICDYYLKANLFICPSSIENSPNSLGEAQLLGVPCFASYIDGVPDMMKGKEKNMYRFEEIEMLADKVCESFRLEENVDTEYLKKQALMKHDKKQNPIRLLTI